MTTKKCDTFCLHSMKITQFYNLLLRVHVCRFCNKMCVEWVCRLVEVCNNHSSVIHLLYSDLWSHLRQVQTQIIPRNNSLLACQRSNNNRLKSTVTGRTCISSSNSNNATWRCNSNIIHRKVDRYKKYWYRARSYKCIYIWCIYNSCKCYNLLNKEWQLSVLLCRKRQDGFKRQSW